RRCARGRLSSVAGVAPRRARRHRHRMRCRTRDEPSVAGARRSKPESSGQRSIHSAPARAPPQGSIEGSMGPITRRQRWMAVGAIGSCRMLGGGALVVVTATPAPAAVSVGNEGALRTAFGDTAQNHIDLTADITLDSTCPDGAVTRTGTHPITVD